MVWSVASLKGFYGTNPLSVIQLFARKELYFERMSERDRKQIVAEVYLVRFSLREVHSSPPFLGTFLKILNTTTLYAITTATWTEMLASYT
jgi:hypothetical protein